MREEVKKEVPAQPDSDITLEAIHRRLLPVQAVLGTSETGGPDEEKLKYFFRNFGTVPVDPPVENIYRIDRAYVERLEKDMPYVETFEEAGTDGMNKLLKKLLSIAHRPGERKDKENAIETLDDLLHRAIHLFPHAVSSIEVTIGEHTAEVLANYNDPHFFGTAKHLGEVQQSSAANDQTKGATRFRLALPYEGNARDMRESREPQNQISFAFFTLPKGRINEYVPVIQIRPLLEVGQLTIPLKLTRSIKFCTSEGPNPWYVPQRKPHSKKIDRFVEGPHINPVEHYLTFRGFFSRAAKRNNKELAKESKDLLKTIPEEKYATIQRELREPHMYDPFLWDETYDSSGAHILRHGFLVFRDSETGRSILYELNELVLQGSTAEYASQAKLAQMILDRVIMAKTYTGTSIIRRLATLPKIPFEYLFPHAVVPQSALKAF